mmetsp:Transcript_18504/g.26254  ORF Transcript_18504/g.26254 Transcript_18504/m.26254 type:complete len:242 (-) Transcript_18504:254-979(-)
MPYFALSNNQFLMRHRFVSNDTNHYKGVLLNRKILSAFLLIVSFGKAQCFHLFEARRYLTISLLFLLDGRPMLPMADAAAECLRPVVIRFWQGSTTGRLEPRVAHGLIQMANFLESEVWTCASIPWIRIPSQVTRSRMRVKNRRTTAEPAIDTPAPKVRRVLDANCRMRMSIRTVDKEPYPPRSIVDVAMRCGLCVVEYSAPLLADATSITSRPTALPLEELELYHRKRCCHRQQPSSKIL